MDIETWALGESPGVQGLSLQERKELDNGYLLESTRKTLALLREYRARITLFTSGSFIPCPKGLIRPRAMCFAIQLTGR